MTKRIISQDAPVNELLGKLSKPTEPAAAEPEQTVEAAAEKAEPIKKDTAEEYTPSPYYCETKKVRLQLIFKPTVAREMKRFCKARGLSVNEYINSLVIKDLDARAEADEQNGTHNITEEYKTLREVERLNKW